MNTDTHPLRRTQRLPGTAVLIGIGVALLAAIVAVAVIGGRGVVEYPEGSPEAAAQTYVQALFDGEDDAAYAMLSPALQARCVAVDSDVDATAAGSATFEDVHIRDDRVVIDVRLTGARFEPGPLPIQQEEIDARLTLVEIDGEWRISAGDWPLYRCIWR